MKKGVGKHIIWLIGTIPLICFCCSLSGYMVLYPGGDGIVKFFEEIDRAIFNPVWNGLTPKLVLVGLLFYMVFYIYAVTKIKPTMPGQEYGTASFGDAKALSRKYADKKDESNNRILSQNLKVSYDGYKTKLNNNTLVAGGSGGGKTRSVVKPNVLELHDSMVIVDPDGGILRDTGQFLKDNEYAIQVLNLVDPQNSNHFNPFPYIHGEIDILKLVSNINHNTTPPDSQKDNPFWENSFKMLVKALMYYIWDKGLPEEQNLPTLFSMLDYAKSPTDAGGNTRKSALDMLFDALEEEEPYNPAVLAYRKSMDGAEETVKSILQTVHTKFEYFRLKEISGIFSSNEIDFTTIGKKKTAIFCVIPEDDNSFNFLTGMFFTQLTQELFRQAKFNKNSRLDLDITIWLDEFANTGFMDGFSKKLATVRKYGINLMPIIQSTSQLETLFKNNEWKGIIDNCDSYIYLGSNSDSTQKDISERLGEKTIVKQSTSVSRGRNGSNSTSTDVIARKLMTKDEVARMENNKCIVFLKGSKPILDDKYDYTKHRNYKYTASATGKVYEHKPIRISNISDFKDTEFELLKDMYLDDKVSEVS